MGVIDVEIRQEKDVGLNISTKRNISLGLGPSSGTSNYEYLSHKPSINSVELVGDKSFEDLGDKTLTNIEIKQMFDRIFKGE